MQKPNGYWTKERILSNARQYDIQSDWRISNANAYMIAQEKRWMTEATAHMKKSRKPDGYWTKDKVMVNARKYTILKDWRVHGSAAYSAAARHGWLREATEHLEVSFVKTRRWTKENIRLDAQKYTLLQDWRNNSSVACRIAVKKGWLEDVASHLKRIRKKKGYWSREAVILDALNYTRHKDWIECGTSAYVIAYKHGWFKEATAHMTKK